jgi:hypothetical protein
MGKLPITTLQALWSDFGLPVTRTVRQLHSDGVVE